MLKGVEELADAVKVTMGPKVIYAVSHFKLHYNKLFRYLVVIISYMSTV